MENLLFHRWPKSPALAEIWCKQVAKSRSSNFNPVPGTQGTFICSNHFPLGKRTPDNPGTDYPSFLTVMDYKHTKSQKKRKSSKNLEESSPSPKLASGNEPDTTVEESKVFEEEQETLAQIPLQFEQFM